MYPYITSYNSHWHLYKNYLTSIGGVKFTFREIDILACILHNRGYKKIAVICGVALSTVSTHINNIMSKIQCNSKEKIIDFTHEAGVTKILEEYYYSLIVKYNFEKALEQIAAQVNKNLINCCYVKDIELKNPMLYRTIQSHFRKANINLLEIKNPTFVIDLSSIEENSYYQNFFKALASLLDYEKVNSIYKEFEDNCRAVSETFDIKPSIYIKNRYFDLTYFWIKRNLIYKFIGFFLVLIFLVLLLSQFYNFRFLSYRSSNVIEDLEEFLSSSTASQFTANNISHEQSTNNQSLIKIIEKIIASENIKEVQKYFNRPEISSDFLMKYLHVTQALSLYYLYNEHDGDKARKILLYSKNLAENYINSRSKVRIDFNNITEKELLVELSIAQHLPELYSRILYAIGRSYMYNNDCNELEIGRQFFELTKYLGKKLNLFEGYMSNLHGIIPIEKRQLEILLKNPDKNQADIKTATVTLSKIITIYQNLKLDNNSYILDYDPSKNTNQQTIIPSSNLHNLLCCDMNTVNIYKFLIEIDNKNETSTYVDGIINILNKSTRFPGLLQIIEDSAPRKRALLYNDLGEILLLLDNKQYEDPKLRLFLQNRLNINSDNNLHLAEQLFDHAKTNSRETDYTKADALDGLAKVYRKYLYSKTMSIEQVKKLEKKIAEYGRKRDLINKTLQRKT